MYSLRLLAVFAVLAAVSAFPANDKSTIPKPITTISDDDSPWLNISPFSLFAPLWKLIPSFADIGPKISCDDDKFQVVINVKDYRKSDLKVKVKGDFIFVQGSQETKEDDTDILASQFFHTYTLPANSSSADVTAKLTSNGYLVVTAPVSESVDKSKETDREVPIVETGAPYQKEQKVEKTTTESVEIPKNPPTTTEATTPVAEEEKKEPSTPSEPEEATEKDNVIPHGNDVPV